MKIQFTTGDAVQIERHGAGYQVRVGETEYQVEVSRLTNTEILFSVDGERHHAHLARTVDGRGWHVAFDADVFSLTRAEAQRRARESGAGDASLAATMHGQVVRVLVAEGDAVARGDTLVVLEAMKMELRVTAPHEGHVRRLLCAQGDIVERGQPLVELTN